jgi:ubiquinone/menaquinone biosynthesis C-methylase UbiE
MIGVVLLLGILGGGGLLLYWLLVLTEGTYLGPRVVTRLYDWGAPTYDRIKDFDAVDDARALAIPLVRALRGVGKPLVLDVATGTGRLPLSLLRNLEFEGSIVGLDISFRMLEEARRKGARYEDRLAWLWKDGLALPFEAGSFDAVSCLEALEFMPDPAKAVQEMARVLRPGGTMLLSNRIGWDALLMPGRAFSKERLRNLLGDLGLDSVQIVEWQSYYDLIWARREGVLAPREGRWELEDVLRCPSCGESCLSKQSATYVCGSCGAGYRVKQGIVCLQAGVDGQGKRTSVQGRFRRAA